MGTTKKDIESALMRGADSLRDTIDAANYKDYELPLMFVKYLSDTYREKVEELEKTYEGIRLERQKRYLPYKLIIYLCLSRYSDTPFPSGNVHHSRGLLDG